MKLKWLPPLLAGLHAAVTVLVFRAAMVNPERGGLLPILIYGADYPCSVFIMWLRNLWHDPQHGYIAGLVFDGSAFLVLGSAWYFCIGLLIRWTLLRLKRWTR